MNAQTENKHKRCAVRNSENTRCSAQIIIIRLKRRNYGEKGMNFTNRNNKGVFEIHIMTARERADVAQCLAK